MLYFTNLLQVLKWLYISVLHNKAQLNDFEFKMSNYSVKSNKVEMDPYFISFKALP